MHIPNTMPKHKVKKRSSRVLKRVLLTLLMVVAPMGTLFVLLSNKGILRYMELQKVLARFESENQNLSSQRQLLEIELAKLQDKTYVETIARESMGLLKNNEIFIIIDETKAVDKKTTTQ